MSLYINRLSWDRAVTLAIEAGWLYRCKQRVYKSSTYGWTWECADREAE